MNAEAANAVHSGNNFDLVLKKSMWIMLDQDCENKIIQYEHMEMSEIATVKIIEVSISGGPAASIASCNTAVRYRLIWRARVSSKRPTEDGELAS